MIPGTNNTIDTYQLSEASSKETYSGSKTLDGEECYIEQIDPKLAVILDEQNAFNLYHCYLDGDSLNVKISDKVVDQDSATYVVQNVEVFGNNTDVENHTRLTLVKKYDFS